MYRRSIAIVALLALVAGSAMAEKPSDKVQKEVSNIEKAWSEYLERIDDFFEELRSDALSFFNREEKNSTKPRRSLFAVEEDKLPLTVESIKNITDNVIESVEQKTEEDKEFLKAQGEKLKDFLKDGLASLQDMFKKSSKLMKDATKIAGEQFSELRTSFEGFTIDDLLDGTWKEYLPEQWDKFSLEDLALFDIENYMPEGDFSTWPPLKADGTPYEYSDLVESYEELVDEYCTDELYVKGAKVPTGCVGPTVSIALAPQECVLDEISKELVCVPAKLVLIKTPLICNLKFKAASFWQGKECKFSKEFGVNKVISVGAKEYRVVLKEKTEKDQTDELVGLFEPVKTKDYKKDDAEVKKN